MEKVFVVTTEGHIDDGQDRGYIRSGISVFTSEHYMVEAVYKYLKEKDSLEQVIERYENYWYDDLGPEAPDEDIIRKIIRDMAGEINYFYDKGVSRYWIRIDEVSVNPNTLDDGYHTDWE